VSANALGNMITDDQSAVIAFLEAAATHGGELVRRVDTHSAIVFLAGARAWKLKRAVRYDYLDFSTVERRRLACQRELTLNQRTAPSIYRGVTPVVRRLDGSLAIGARGVPVDWLVEMNRFDEEYLFDRLAARQELRLNLMRPLATEIARFHAGAEPRPDHGGTAGMTFVARGNADGFAEFGSAMLDVPTAQRLTGDTLREIERHSALLEIRRAAGLVRQCHGDLHLRNIVLLGGRPTLFDAVEFNDAIACTDVLYDLAFLLMDLWRRQLPGHANAVWNAYLAETRDHSGLPLVPLFLSCRAAIRAKTSATAARLQSSADSRAGLERAARDYLAMAGRFLQPPPPCLVAIGGLSGSGKSTLALALAASVGRAPGAVVLRSDEVRKRICGKAPLDRLGPDGYTSDVTQRVYAVLAATARAVIRAGYGVIVDAVYAKPADRQAVERAAIDAGVPFYGLWLDAPAPILQARLGARVDDASDAEAAVLRLQQAQDIGPITWRRIDASAPPDVVVRRAAVCIGAPAAAA
jgi:aminoglycoside phosphotransferase family enzyme/predicted kinase